MALLTSASVQTTAQPLLQRHLRSSHNADCQHVIVKARMQDVFRVQRPGLRERFGSQSVVSFALASSASSSWRLRASESADAAVAVGGRRTAEELDQEDIAKILEITELLKSKRDMSPQEIRLTLMIEDPREAERRRQLGIENESGCSRDEIAAAFVDVYEGRIPADRTSLRTLADEMRNWPRLEEIQEEAQPQQKQQSMYAQITDVGLPANAKPKPPSSSSSAWDEAITEEENVQEKDLGEMLPPWVGYGFLYGISFVPVFIVVAVVIVLFINSLQ